MLRNITILISGEKNEIVKQSKITTQQPKPFKKPNIVDVKSVTTEHPRTSCKLFKTIRQTEKVS